MHHSYVLLIKILIDNCISIKDFELGESVYKKCLPKFEPAIFNDTDIDKIHSIWLNHSSLIFYFFAIQYYLKGVTNEQWSIFSLIIKWFNQHNDDLSKNKAIIIEIFLDTHEKWKDEITPEEEETFWTNLVLWIIQDFPDVQLSDFELYQIAKRFYDSYKKTKRLDPLAYRMLNYLVLIIGFAENKLPYSSLMEAATAFLKNMKQSFCERQGENVNFIFSQILEFWIPTKDNTNTNILENFIKQINSTVYKKNTFGDIFQGKFFISSWFEEKAYCLIALIYQRGLLSRDDIESYCFEIAYSLHDGNKLDEAKVLYERLIQKDQTSGSIYNNLAVIYRNKDKNFDKALEYFEQAKRIDPEEELYQNNINVTIDLIKKEKERPKKQIDNYFKKTDKKLKSICFTLFKLEDLEIVTTEDIENSTNFKGSYLIKHLNELQSLDLIHNDKEKGWRLEEPIREKVESYVDPKLERQIIRNNKVVMYRPIFYHESEISLYRVLTELFPQHLVFPNMDLKTIIQVEKIREHLDHDHLDYMFKAHVDFAIIDTTTYFPILTFERDSDFQDREPNKVNALKKNLIFETSGLPLIRIRYNSAMDYERLKEEIKQSTKEFILEISGNTDSETRRILESINPARFGILKDIPTDEDLKNAWKNIVGHIIANHTRRIELDQIQFVLKVTLDEDVRQVLELGADGIKSKLYQAYPMLNSIQFYWESRQVVITPVST